jgi:hypothetical protein
VRRPFLTPELAVDEPVRFDDGYRVVHPVIRTRHLAKTTGLESRAVGTTLAGLYEPAARPEPSKDHDEPAKFTKIRC